MRYEATGWDICGSKRNGFVLLDSCGRDGNLGAKPMTVQGKVLPGIVVVQAIMRLNDCIVLVGSATP